MTPHLLRLQTLVSKGTAEIRLQTIDSPAVELDNDLAAAVVVDLLELANVAWKNRVSFLLREIKHCTSLEVSENV